MAKGKKKKKSRKREYVRLREGKGMKVYGKG
jgi:hypothetical protein